jgi:hypothetical protein
MVWMGCKCNEGHNAQAGVKKMKKEGCQSS